MDIWRLPMLKRPKNQHQARTRVNWIKLKLLKKRPQKGGSPFLKEAVTRTASKSNPKRTNISEEFI